LGLTLKARLEERRKQIISSDTSSKSASKKPGHDEKTRDGIYTIDVQEIITTKDSARKRSHEEMTEDGVPAVEIQDSEIETQTSATVAVPETDQEDEVRSVEPAPKRSRFKYAQFASGVVIGAIGIFAGIINLPESVVDF
jgi:hypothetical protein